MNTLNSLFSQNPERTPRKESASPLCQICGKPIPVEIAETNGNGKATHDDCYLSKVRLVEGKADGDSSTRTDHPSVRQVRPWKVIAEEVCHEQDSAKLNKLVAELNQALDEQGIGKSARQVNRHGEVKADGNSSASSEKH
jgi:formate-dependent nitrite reductase cytochrome c552 subunit